MQWRKLFDLNPKYLIFSDKVAARGFIQSLLGESYLPECLWKGRDPKLIPFDELDPPFFVKGTHGSGQTISVTTTCGADQRRAIVDEARGWLLKNHGLISLEPGYVDVAPGVIIERAITASDQSPPLEIKAYVFGGVVADLIVVVVEEGSRNRLACHVSRDWRLLNRRLEGDGQLVALPPKPKFLDEMISAAEIMARGLDHLRIDMYHTDRGIFMGEVTVYSHSGLAVFVPDEDDLAIGTLWEGDFSISRALRSMIGGPPLTCR